MKMAYIRISSKDQNADRQIIKMQELEIEERFIFIDEKSGKDFNREQYQALRRIVRQGDIIYIDALDRLGRNYDEIISEWKYITRELGADIVALEQESLFDSRRFKELGDIGKLMEDQFLSLLSYVAEQERKKIRQRQAEGIAVAKAKGKTFGRPKIETSENFIKTYNKWKSGEITAVKAMKLLDMKKTTFYRRVKEIEEELKE